ncbi:Flp pilus assembly complex ATPase component TadA [Patescibacteria group bacterium]|nr:Flp pilus assembly complex ATPase component TadA [Patescibacteria group bacterium]MBU1890102.1 Flp pilus assembly complex ATPase component TadA [Patescibacteria group bacterium]
MLTPEQVKQIILNSKVLPEAEIKKAATEAANENISLANYLIGQKTLSENGLYESIANHFGVPFVNLKKKVIRKDLLRIIPEQIVQAHQVVAFDQNPETVKLATTDPSDLEIFEFIKKKTNLIPEIHVTTPSSIKEILKQYHKGIKAKFKEMAAPGEGEEIVSDQKDLKKLAQDLPIIRIVDTLLEYAIYEGASDIHIEPTEKDVIVRYRIDGILREVMTLPKKIKSGVVARIKILSNLKLDEHRLPQDGRFKVNTEEYKVAFRVSIIPVYDGEKIVLRLLNESAQIMSLEQIGLLTDAYNSVKKNIQKPHGMILVTGPTGSGKTTTLYTILNILNKPGVNISTVEDPIEYRMPRVNQSQVNPKIGFTFSVGLRALLRQDPNIIMVGEIRDKETAEISSNAAMTGHLVLSTLHTNDAVGALPRLLEIGIPSFLVASTTNLVMAQRLVRKVCPSCIMSYNLSKKAIAELEKQINFNELLESLSKSGAIASLKVEPESLLFYRGKGCQECGQTGYKGRLGIYEVLEIDHEIADLITKNPTSEDLLKLAQAKGMMTMMEDGFTKAKMGITTIEEVLRVTKD